MIKKGTPGYFRFLIKQNIMEKTLNISTTLTFSINLSRIIVRRASVNSKSIFTYIVNNSYYSSEKWDVTSRWDASPFLIMYYYQIKY